MTSAASAMRRRVLLVEDDPDDRGRVRRMLRGRARSYEITECETGGQAITYLRDHDVDCVLLDFQLPDQSGIELLNAVRGAAGTPVPFVVLTGRDDDAAAASTLEAGAEDYVLKDGLVPHALVRAIENAIEKFHIRRDLEAQRAATELRNRRLELGRQELELKIGELASATQARDRFMAMMSHEMRTPLNAVLGYAELLELEIDGALSPGQRRHVDRIRIGSRHLLDLINDVLDLARADADKLELDIRPVQVAAVLEEVHALLENQARQRGLEFTIDTGPATIPLVLADLQRLRQIVMNLVGNAIKFTDAGAVRVAAAVSSDAAVVRVIVADSGIGMAPDVAAQAFNEFYQGDNELTRPYGGSGLGLAISRRLARAMGGEIELQSEPNVGSTFVLVLPAATPDSSARAEDTARHAARMHQTGSDRAAPSPIVVAAFGESAAALEALAKQLLPSVRMLWTTSEAEVLELVDESRPSLVILDIGSRGGAAWRVGQQLANLPADRAPATLLLPAIVASEAATPSTIDLGWVALVPKPFTATQLTRAVATAAGRPDDSASDTPYRLEVMIVDDDEDSRRVAAKFLSDRQILVRDCIDGETALTEMRVRPPDVVVLDLMMPVLDGFGVLAAMRADPLLAGVPVVVLTAKSLTEAERQFLARTAVRVLQKGEHRLADIAAFVLRSVRARPL